jgi:hypothetical protein
MMISARHVINQLRSIHALTSSRAACVGTLLRLTLISSRNFVVVSLFFPFFATFVLPALGTSGPSDTSLSTS